MAMTHGDIIKDKLMSLYSATEEVSLILNKAQSLGYYATPLTLLLTPAKEMH